MPELRVEFITNVKRTHNVESFRFMPSEKFYFKAGQFIQIIFDENDKTNKIFNKFLSISCAPDKDYIEVTKKITDSEFSKKLQSLKQGDSVLIKGPMGHCTFEGEFEKIAFIVGGIGVTPVISILEDIVNKNLSTDVVFLYSNWNENDIAFKEEVDNWVKEKENIRVVHSLMEGDPDNKDYYIGQINEEFVAEHIPDYKERMVYLFGPPGMVKAMNDICSKLNCEKFKVKAENFIGY